MTRITTSNFPSIFNDLRNDPFLVGFDQIFDRVLSSSVGNAQQTSYPPYNIVKGPDDTFSIEIALAGFTESDLQVTVHEDTLTVESKKNDSIESPEYIHQGIAKRSFKRAWTLSPTIEVTGAEFVNGMLIVRLVNVVPEEKKPRTINIGTSSVNNPEFLAEDKG